MPADTLPPANAGFGDLARGHAGWPAPFLPLRETFADRGSEEAAHCWRIPLLPPPATLERLRQTLCPEESARAARFRFARDREEWVAARGGMRVLLGRYLDCPPHAVRLAAGDNGKPCLASAPAHARLRFNLSHTPGLALLAVTEGQEVGIDVERLRADFDPLALAQSFFSADEIEILRAVVPALRPALFFAFWTAKEAIVKALGTGLSTPTTEFSVAALAHRQTAAAHGFTVRLLHPGGAYAAALALPSAAQDARGGSRANSQSCGDGWHG